MAYLKNDNSDRVIVDAILTKYGKEKLSNLGSLGITKFAVFDDDVDYSLYNTGHPMGSDYYDSAILNMPTLEVLPSNTTYPKYPLFSLDNSTPLDVISSINLTLPSDILNGISKSETYSIRPSISNNTDTTEHLYLFQFIRKSNISYGEEIEIIPMPIPSALSQFASAATYPKSDNTVFHESVGITLTVRRFPTKGFPIEYKLIVTPITFCARPSQVDITIVDNAVASRLNYIEITQLTPPTTINPNVITGV